MDFEAIGTHWSITLLEIPEGWTDASAQELNAQIRERIETFDATYSRFRGDSLVSEMARAAGTYELPADAEQLVNLYERLYHVTKGKFTPLVGQLISDAGYDANYSLTPRELVDVKSWDEVLTYEFPALTLAESALLDFGAAGKGYLVDIVAELIEASGCTAYIVNAGGDIRVAGGIQRIGLEDPNDASKIIGVAELSSGSICGSAVNRRAWGKFHHIFDPDTLDSVRNIQVVWVTSSTALYADALATCLFLIPAEELAYQLSDMAFEYLIITSERSLQTSAHFPAELFT